MNQLLFIGLIVSAIISLILIVHLWCTNEYLAIKIVLSLITFVPFIGPVFYCFYFGMSGVKSQARHLQNRGARGEYTDTWNSMAPMLKSFRKEKVESEVEEEKRKKEKRK